MHQVRHKYTGQVMVMKEMKNCTEEAKLTFLKEVCVQVPTSISINVHLESFTKVLFVLGMHGNLGAKHN